MNGIEVQLIDMLLRREQRAITQNTLIHEYSCPVISFCMNIPGPIKTNEKIRAAFEEGKSELLTALALEHAEILQSEETHENTGDELILAVHSSAIGIKELTTQIEEHHPLGRLFDMDVIDEQGNKLSRPVYRKCLICARQAQECARARTHSVAEMQKAIDTMLEQIR